MPAGGAGGAAGSVWLKDTRRGFDPGRSHLATGLFILMKSLDNLLHNFTINHLAHGYLSRKTTYSLSAAACSASNKTNIFCTNV